MRPKMGRPFCFSPGSSMKTLPFLLIAIVAISAQDASAGDWFFMPSSYSHSPVTGQRVRQFAPTPPVIVYERPDYTRSGYRQTRSSINVGGSSDNYHVVEQYGQNIRPYGEWLFPYRPYGVPYDAWGPPFGGVNGDYYGDAYLRGGDARRGYGRGGYRFDDRDRGFRDRVRFDDRRYDDRRFDDRGFDARSREYGRYNGLFDGRGIPGDDEHYLDHPSRLDQMNDREFYRPRSR